MQICAESTHTEKVAGFESLALASVISLRCLITAAPPRNDTRHGLIFFAVPCTPYVDDVNCSDAITVKSMGYNEKGISIAGAFEYPNSGREDIAATVTMVGVVMSCKKYVPWDVCGNAFAGVITRTTRLTTEGQDRALCETHYCCQGSQINFWLPGK